MDEASKLWTAATAAAADRHTIDGLGMLSAVLIERAALCVSAVVERQASDVEARTGRSANVVVVCGPGNNGGDGLAVARQLHGRGLAVQVVVVGERPNAAVAAQLGLARSHGVEVLDGLPVRLEPGVVIVDALLGTGSRGSPRGSIRAALVWLAGLASLGPRVVAIDVPSGVDVDCGSADELAVRAAVTVTFAHSKPGLHVTPGREHAGAVVIADIGLVGDPELGIDDPVLIDPRWVADRLRELPMPRHKGMRGHVGVIGGSPGTPGAAILAGSAALRAGAGLVTLAGFDPAMQAAVIASRPELMLALESAGAKVPHASVLVVGPGLTAAERLAELPGLDAGDPRPMVWDATGLDGFGLGRSAGPRILTPHPGEAARLLARLDEPTWTNARVQADRVTAARTLAERSGAIVVLKGGGTIVAEGRRQAIAIPGGPSLATAGSGDVLAGTIGALLARGLAPWAAACVGVHVHGLAGDASPSLGTVALDVAEGLPAALDRATRGELGEAWPTRVLG